MYYESYNRNKYIINYKHNTHLLFLVETNFNSELYEIFATEKKKISTANKNTPFIIYIVFTKNRFAADTIIPSGTVCFR